MLIDCAVGRLKRQQGLALCCTKEEVPLPSKIRLSLPSGFSGDLCICGFILLAASSCGPFMFLCSTDFSYLCFCLLPLVFLRAFCLSIWVFHTTLVRFRIPLVQYLTTNHLTWKADMQDHAPGIQPPLKTRHIV